MDTKSRNFETQVTISKKELEGLGGGEVAYIRELLSEQAQQLYPTLEDMPEGIKVFVVHAADGTPIALADSRTAAVGNALENDLHPVSIH
ncbi:MAG: DUF1150 family protein [Methyloligellaceae bacterium]